MACCAVSGPVVSQTIMAAGVYGGEGCFHCGGQEAQKEE
jgi:hypothetical protein